MPILPIPIFGALVLMFLFLRTWLATGRLSMLAALLGLCAAQTAIIALAQHYHVPGMRLVQPVTATLIAPFAWVTFVTTTARPRQAGDWLNALIPLAALAALATAPQFLDVLIPAVFAGYGLAIVTRALRGPDLQPRSNLGSGELPARIWLAIGAALIVSALSDLLIVATMVAGLGHLRPWIISLFSVGNLILIGLFSLSQHLETRDADTRTAPAPATPDEEVWQAVQDHMARRRPYLDPDLTLSKLSRQLGIPAKTLSTTINRATGENVSRYVNAARIETAMRALADGETVTGAMLSSGFNTKSNFNREFLRVSGQSPSAWLEARTA